jgi:hypothetical protein
MARRVALLGSVFLVWALLPISAGAVVFTEGANGVGDPYFPLDGNGGYDVEHYLLSVTYKPSTDMLSGVATIEARATQNLSRFNLDFVGLTVAQIHVNGSPATWTRSSHELRVTPAAGILNGSHFHVVVEYSGVPVTLPELGISGFIHTNDGAAVIGEPHVAATWYPANDHPTDKASYTFAIRVPAGREAIANGRLVSQRTRDGWTTWTWDAPEPMASYLATMMIGQFEMDSYRDGGIDYWDAIDASLFQPPGPIAPQISPTDGEQMLFSGVGEPVYKRLTRVIDVPAGGTTLSFDTFHDTEPAFDFLFVEKRTAGGNDWTTLRETSGKTSQDPGACPFIIDVHPFLAHYLTPGPGEKDPCTPTGSTGKWWASSGPASDWERWTFNLSNGTPNPIQVEVSISYANDFSFELRGVTLDNIVVASGAGTTSFEDDADTLDGWVAAAAPAGSAANPNTWTLVDVLEPPPPPPPVSDAIQASFARQPEFIAFLEGIYGPYPFTTSGGIVDNAPVIFALENQTRPTYAPFFFEVGAGDSVVVHELAHQWVGDYVAVQDWRQTWLNEGFARYTEWLWNAREGFGSAQETFDFLYQELRPNNPFWDVKIGNPGPDLIFHGAVYNRGAMTLQALRVTVGRRAFFRILREWVNTQGGGNATTAEFIALSEQVSGQQLDSLFDAWLFTRSKPARPSPTLAAAEVPQLNGAPPRAGVLALKLMAEQQREVVFGP